MRQGTQDILGSLPEIHPKLDPQSVELRIESVQKSKDSHCIRVRGDIVDWQVTHHVEQKVNLATGLVEAKAMQNPIYTLKTNIATGLGYLPLNLQVSERILKMFLDGKKLRIEIDVEPVPQEAERRRKKMTHLEKLEKI